MCGQCWGSFEAAWYTVVACCVCKMKRAKTVGESATAGWRRGKSKIKIEFAVYPPPQVSTAVVEVR